VSNERLPARRRYTQRLRADETARTRARILAITRERLADADQLSVQEIARLSGVSVQTLYSHFGSKGGLLAAVTEEISREVGLLAGFDRVWLSRDGEAALRTMVETTLRFWHDAWSFVQFALRVRRSDVEVEDRVALLDDSRLADLVVICRRLRQEKRLKPSLTPVKAASLVSALTSPYVYEELVKRGGMSAPAATRMVVDAAADAVLRPGTQPARATEVDWAKLGLK